MVLANTTPKPIVEHHLTFGELKGILSTLPGDAVLHAVEDQYAPENDFSWSSAGNFYLDTRSKHEDGFTPATVGSFRDYLGSLEDMDDNFYVRLMAPFTGAVNGVRINSDGSYTLSAVNPDAMP
jgi:hypothetical protein